MKHLPIALLAFLVLTGCAKSIEVSSAEDFIKALGSDRTIVIEPGTYNLTPALDKMFFQKDLPRVDYRVEDYDGSTAAIADIFDGKELCLLNLSNLTIKCPSIKNRAELQVEPRYAFVFYLNGCDGISFENIVMGHTEGGYCDGGVIDLNDCANISFSNCDLYGCGTEGICAEVTEGLKFFDSSIHDCTYDIMTIGECDNFLFKDSEFYSNREFSLFNIHESDRISFKDCIIRNNDGTLFFVDEESNVELDGCTIDHDPDEYGTISDLYIHDCTWVNGENDGFFDDVEYDVEDEDLSQEGNDFEFDEDMSFVQVGKYEDADSHLKEFGITMKNKPEGWIYRLREEVQVEGLEPTVRTANLQLFISDPTDFGTMALYRKPMASDDYDFVVVFYNKAGEMFKEFDLCEITGVHNCEVQDVRYADGDLYFNLACPSYSSEISGRGSKLYCLDPDTATLRWETPYLKSNDIFIIYEDSIICGYGFTNEDDWLYLVDRSSGIIYWEKRIPKAHQYLEMVGDTLYVIDANGTLYEYERK